MDDKLATLKYVSRHVSRTAKR